MIPLNSDEWCYVNTPRTSSTSHMRALRGKRGFPTYCEPLAAVPEHRAARHAFATKLRSIIGAERWEEIYTFGTVRNPFDRLVSAWCIASSVAQRSAPEFQAWAKRTIGRAIRGELDMWSHVQVGGALVPIWLPQSMWLCDADGTVLVKHLIHYESMHEDYARVVKSTLEGVRPYLDRLNQSQRREIPLAELYADDELKQMVTDFFATDFRVFKYEVTL